MKYANEVINAEFRAGLSPSDQAYFDQEVEKIKKRKREPGYVSEFPPSSIIDDSPEGQVRAYMILFGRRT